MGCKISLGSISFGINFPKLYKTNFVTPKVQMKSIVPQLKKRISFFHLSCILSKAHWLSQGNCCHINVVVNEWPYYKYASHNKNKRIYIGIKNIYTNSFHCQDAFGFNEKQSGSKEPSFVW